MQSLVVFLAVAAVARASYLPLAQPPHHPAIVLDPHGRPLDTAEVIGARALHLQAKALEHGYLGHAAIAPALVAAPSVSVWGAHASPLLGHGHLLKKRSLGLWGSHAAIAAPIAHSIVAPAVIAAPAHAVSHQSRVDVHHSPAIVSHAVAAPVVAHALPAAVSHQSHVDIRTSPAVVSHAIAAPVIAAPSISVWGAHGVHASPLLGHGHLLKKRSLGLWGSHAAISAPIAHSIVAPAVIAAPAHAVSHQSRVDVHHSPAIVSHAVATPVISHVAAPVVAHALPAAVSHQSRVDIRTSPAVVAHAVAPIAHGVPLLHSAPLAHGLHGVHGVHGW